MAGVPTRVGPAGSRTGPAPRAHRPGPSDPRTRPVGDIGVPVPRPVGAPPADPDRAVPPASRPAQRRWSALVRRRSLLTVLGFLIASLVVPAATKQWADRAGELALKKELVSQINTTVTKAVAITDCTARLATCFPEGRSLRDPAATQDSRAEADVAYGRALFESKTEWAAGSTSISSVVQAYFASTPIDAAWTEHRQAVSAFLRLSSSECGAARDADTELLRGYLPGTGEDTWTLLGTDIGVDCQGTSIEFESGYATLAQDLLNTTPRLTQALVQSNAEGYSNGLGDFVGDLWPV